MCYRIRDEGIEFLLVRSRGGRWIFPKGGLEAGLTQAQSAALEAYEEAGVHGRIEVASFARYVRRKHGGLRRSPAKCSERRTVVHTHLCEVLQLTAPPESNRNRTWLAPEKAKRRLRQDRTIDFGEQLAGIVDRAVSRIRRLHASSASRGNKDALQTVRFEAFEFEALKDFCWRSEGAHAAFIRHLLHQRRSMRSAASVKIEEKAGTRRALWSGPDTRFWQPQLRLGPGVPGATHKVTAINQNPKPDRRRR